MFLHGQFTQLNTAEHPRQKFQRSQPMSVAKVIELTSESTVSFDDAVARGVAKASKSVDDVRGAWVKEQKVIVEKGKVVKYRVNLKVTFQLT